MLCQLPIIGHAPIKQFGFLPNPQYQQMNEQDKSRYLEHQENLSDILESSGSLKQLARAISLSPEKIAEICQSQQLFKAKLKDFNQIAVIKIQKEQYNQALIYLEEAEKLLEAAVNSANKKIDRVYIVCTLQNEACAYQRLWELERSVEYMEAVIHNLQCQVQISTSAQLQQIYFNQQQIDSQESIKQSINKLTLMGLYYLEYLAVTSQIKDHYSAYNIAVKALKTFKVVCQKCKILETIESNLNGQFNPRQQNMMNQLLSLSEEANTNQLAEQLKYTQQAILKSKHYHKKKKSLTDKTTIYYRDFTIGQVMQINPITLTELTRKINSKDSMNNRLDKALYVSVCLFSIATEKRLISNDLARKIKENDKREGEKKEALKISEFFHLKAIEILCRYIPCEGSKYLQHIIKSFKNHHGIDLLQAQVSQIFDEVSSIELQSQNLIPQQEKAEPFHGNPHKFISLHSYHTKNNQPKSNNPSKNIKKPIYTINHIRKVQRSEKHIKTIVSENIKIKKYSKSKSKSQRKDNVDQRGEKKSSVLVEKKSHPTTVKSIQYGVTKKSKNQNFPIERKVRNSFSKQQPLTPRQVKPKKSHIYPPKKKKSKPITSTNSKDKSKQKSRSKSNKRLGSNTSKQEKAKKNKAKKKHTKLQQQYFITKDQKNKKDQKHRNVHNSHNSHKSSIKKSSIKFQGNSISPGRNTVTNVISSIKSPSYKTSIKYF